MEEFLFLSRMRYATGRSLSKRSRKWRKHETGRQSMFTTFSYLFGKEICPEKYSCTEQKPRKEFHSKATERKTEAYRKFCVKTIQSSNRLTNFCVWIWITFLVEKIISHVNPISGYLKNLGTKTTIQLDDWLYLLKSAWFSLATESESTESERFHYLLFLPSTPPRLIQ